VIEIIFEILDCLGIGLIDDETAGYIVEYMDIFFPTWKGGL